MPRNLLLAAILTLNGPSPQAVDFRQCTVTHNQPLFPEKHINGTTPVSSLV